MAEPVTDGNLEIRKKVFTKWINYHFQKANIKLKVKDDEFAKSFSDGICLIHLLEILSGRIVCRWNPKPKSRVDKIQNITLCLEMIQCSAVVTPDLIADANEVSVLSLIWSLIQTYHINLPKEDFKMAKIRFRARLQELGIEVINFTSDFRLYPDRFARLVNLLQPGIIPEKKMKMKKSKKLISYAITIAHSQLGIPKLIDSSDILSKHPDELANMTYFAFFVPNTDSSDVLSNIVSPHKSICRTSTVSSTIVMKKSYDMNFSNTTTTPCIEEEGLDSVLKRPRTLSGPVPYTTEKTVHRNLTDQSNGKIILRSESAIIVGHNQKRRRDESSNLPILTKSDIETSSRLPRKRSFSTSAVTSDGTQKELRSRDGLPISSNQNEVEEKRLKIEKNIKLLIDRLPETELRETFIEVGIMHPRIVVTAIKSRRNLQKMSTETTTSLSTMTPLSLHSYSRSTGQSSDLVLEEIPPVTCKKLSDTLDTVNEKKCPDTTSDTKENNFILKLDQESYLDRSTPLASVNVNVNGPLKSRLTKTKSAGSKDTRYRPSVKRSANRNTPKN